MTGDHVDTEFFELLRAHGIRKKVAKSLASLGGNRRRLGSKGEKLARETVENLTAAADQFLVVEEGRGLVPKKP